VRTLFLLMMLLPFCAQAAAQRYEARFDKADWMVERGGVRCVVRQVIPRYGEVRFLQEAGGALEFRLTAHHGPAREIRVSVRTEAPSWRAGSEADELLGELPLVSGRPSMRVAQDAALRLLLELEAGRVPVLSYDDWTRPSRRIEVAISPIRFLAALTTFRDCLDDLPPPAAVAFVMPEPKPSPVEEEAAPPPDSAEREARRRELRYRILSGGRNETVRIRLPGEAGDSTEITAIAEPEPAQQQVPGVDDDNADAADAVATPEPLVVPPLPQSDGESMDGETKTDVGVVGADGLRTEPPPKAE
jgi:hypothetical protein